MTDKEVLQKAIEKVRRKGYYVLIGEDYDWNNYIKHKKYKNIIFSHDFAKAFWKKETEKQMSYISIPLSNDNLGIRLAPAWQYHLQQMVLWVNPIDYLRNFIKE